MVSLKKTAVAVLTFSSSVAFAGTMGMGPVCTPGNVTVPCEISAWDFGIYALHLQPVLNGNWAYAGAAANDAGQIVHRDIDLGWGWGFKLEGSYHFGSGNDINVNWYHMDNSSRHDLSETYYYNIGQKWNAVNAEFGQHVDFGERKDIRFHAGVQYAMIKHNYHNLVNEASVGSYYHDFDGFGPRTGMDMTYNWGNGLAMYANAAAALLIGSDGFNDTVDNELGSRNAMVPELEAKLGAKYDFAMANGLVSLDGGYMWVNYFNAQHYILNGGPSFETDFAMHGPYIGLKWIGNA